MIDDSDLGGEPACWAHMVDEMDTVDVPADDSAHGLACQLPGSTVVDLAGLSDDGGSSGAIWSLPHGGDLDANVVRMRVDDTIDEHVNDDVDVLVVVWSGGGNLIADGRTIPLHPGVIAHVERGARRSVRAGADGLMYLSVHRRREGVSIRRR